VWVGSRFVRRRREQVNKPAERLVDRTGRKLEKEKVATGNVNYLIPPWQLG